MQLLVTYRCNDSCTDLGAELHRRDSHATGRPVHQQRLARRELALREQGVVRGCEDLREAARFGPRERFGNPERGAFMYDATLCLAAPADYGHDPVAGLESLASGAGRDDLAGHLEAWNRRG